MHRSVLVPALQRGGAKAKDASLDSGHRGSRTHTRHKGSGSQLGREGSGTEPGPRAGGSTGSPK